METLINIWNTYKGDVIPVLITILTILIPAIACYAASRIRANGVKEEARAETMRKIAEKEDTRPELDKNAKAIENMKETMDAMQDMIISLSDLFNEAFQSSSLTPEVKEKLNNITSRIKNGVGDDVIESYKVEIDKYKDLYDNVVKELKEAKEKVIDKKNVKRARV